MSKFKQIIVGVSAMLAVIVCLGLVKFLQIRAAIAEHSSFSPPPEAVTSITVEEQRWESTLEAVGSLTASKGAILAAEEPGKVGAVLFESGDVVEAGAVLVELDVSVEEANMKAAEALRDEAEKALKRMEALKAANAISQREYDAALARYREAESGLDSMSGMMARKRIVAPFAGRLGIRKVNVGQFVTPGTEIVPLYVLDPLFANFSLPQSAVPSLAEGQPTRIITDAFPGEMFEGTVTAIDPQLDSSTRMIEIQATVPNPGERLRPGMFAAVTLVLPDVRSVLAIPASSVSYAPYGDTVYVVESMSAPDGKEYRGVRQQIVSLGRKRGDWVDRKSVV